MFEHLEAGHHIVGSRFCLEMFFLDTGVRLAELTNLRLDAVNLETGYARIFGKGRVERIVPLGLELRRAISKYLLKHRQAASGEDALFVNRDGLRLEERGVRGVVIRALAEYVPRKINRTGPHCLRHTFATFNLRETHDLKSTSLIMGHTTTRMTENYIHLTGADVLRNAGGSPLDKIVRTHIT